MADPQAALAALRRLVGPRPDVVEKRMFGGVCFLWRGNMLCGTGGPGFMFRVGPNNDAAARALPGGSPVAMRGRAMAGFFWVDPAACTTAQLRRWLALAEAYVGALPEKPSKHAKATKRRRA